MPYIQADRRSHAATCTSTPGELNYAISQLCFDYLRRRAALLSYGTLNEVVGAMESAKLEFYRRMVEPYEQKKIAENGDIYGG